MPGIKANLEAPEIKINSLKVLSILETSAVLETIQQQFFSFWSPSLQHIHCFQQVKLFQKDLYLYY